MADLGFVIYDQDGNEIGRSLPGENLIKVNLHPGVRSVTTGPPPKPRRFAISAGSPQWVVANGSRYGKRGFPVAPAS